MFVKNVIYKLIIQRLLIILIFSQTVFLANSQSFVENMEWLKEYYSPEKIHIHFDKDFYLTGETIYFKAYITKGNFVEPPYSKTVYVDFYDGNCELIKHFLIPVNESTASGSFQMKENYPFSNIIFKAYTERILKLDSNFVYIKKIPVINSELETKYGSKKTLQKTIIDFFPEGGNYYEGLKSKLAYKISDQFGNPINKTFYIKNNLGKIIDSLKPIHDGMGVIELTPQSTTASFYVEDGGGDNAKKYFLPQPLKFGVDLSVFDNLSEFLVSVTRSDIIPDNYKNLQVIVSKEFEVLYSARINLTQKTSVQFPIDKADFSNGIIQFTLLTDDNRPIEERIIFNNNEDYSFEPEIFIKNKDLNSNGKNEINVIVDQNILTNMSIAITDAQVGYDSLHNSIITDLLLQQNLKGKVFNPMYYFNMNNVDRYDFLDLVMLTNGWRKYNWKWLIDSFDSQVLPVFNDNFIQISGKAFGDNNFNKVKKLKSLTFILQNKQSSKQVYYVTLDSNNFFNIPQSSYFDTCKLYYYQNNVDNSNLAEFLQIGLDKNYIVQKDVPLNDAKFINSKNLLDTQTIAQKKLNSNLKKYLKGDKIEVLQEVIKEVKIKSRRQLLDEKYTSGVFSGGDARIIDVEQDPYASINPDIFTFIATKAPGIIVQQGSDGQRTFQWRNTNVLLYLDQLQIDPSIIQNYTMQNIAYVKIFPPPFFGAIGQGSVGAICFYSKRGDTKKEAPPPASNYKTIIGYSTFKEFYNPTLEDISNPYYSDKRTTLYWNPNVLTDGRSRLFDINFFNNTTANEFRIILEGINSEGKLTHIEKVLKK